MEYLDMQCYFDAVSAASRRSRATLLIITIFSVVMLSAILNSGPRSSQHRQFEVAKDVLLWLTELKEGAEPEGLDGIDDGKERFKLAKILYERDSVLLDSKEAARRTLDPLLSKGIDGRQMIKIPVLDLSLDTRTLTWFGGATYVVLLLMFRFGLYREKENLTITFLEARSRGCLSQCYHLLRMRQVLFIPKSRWNKRSDGGEWQEQAERSGPARDKGNWVWKLLPLLLFLLPLIFQSLLAVFSLRDLMQSGETSRMQALEVLYHSVFFFPVLLLTFSCFGESKQMDVLWNKQKRLIKDLDESLEATLEGDWTYVAKDQRGSFEGENKILIDSNGQLMISGKRTKHVKTSGEIDDVPVDWSSSWIEVREGRVFFQFYVNPPAQKSTRVWCHLEKAGECLAGEYVDLSNRKKIQGNVEFRRVDPPAAHGHA